MDYRIENYSNMKNIELDFGEVEVGVTKIKSIKIVNQNNEKQTYVVERDTISNPLDCTFHTLEYNWLLLPCEYYVCDISYKPISPNRKYIDYFFITDTHKCRYKITVSGYCIGPKVTSSTTKVLMICEKEGCRVQKCIKFTNHTSVFAKFMFDIDIAQCPFKISELSGIIKAFSSKTIAISFEPTDPGIYKYHLTCLILNQDPIILELYGFCGCDSNSKYTESLLSNIDTIEKRDIATSFENYMNDVTNTVKKNLPSISLSYRFIDFGQAEVGMKNVGKRSPQTVSLTNHNNYELFIVWDRDVSEIFSIRPKEARIRGGRSIIFEIRFDPLKERTFYSRELIARAFRMPCCITNAEVPDNLLTSVIPEFVSIRLIGHTYSHGFNDWVPQYEIPETITMPACIPALPVYTTFAIKNFGHQPLMFCFVPPATSHYNIKPMMGLISHDQEYQIISVQLFPESANDQAYVERWAVRLNGSAKNEIYVDFQGFAEQGNLVFGDDNCVMLEPVHINCQLRRSVPVRNPTRHRVRYEYLSNDFPEELHVQQMSGFIDPNETVFHDWTFSPDKLKNYNFDIGCCLSAEIGGREYVVRVDVSTYCMQGSLIAMPEDLSFGEQAYNKLCESEFKIFNFSPVTIHYLLKCQPLKNLEIMKNPENDVKIFPISGTINPGKKEIIKVVLTPTQPGFYELIIKYLLRSSFEANDAIPSVNPKKLCTLYCTCYMPTIQIKDMLYKTETHKPISKLSLWKSLCIDDLNSATKNVQPFQETTIEMKLPVVSLEEDEKFFVKFLLINKKPAEATWTLKKRKTCLCNIQSLQRESIIQRNLNSDCLYCIRDESCIIFPKKIALKQNKTDILTIDMKSSSLHSSGVYWDLNLGDDRNIVLNIRIVKPFLLSGPYLEFKNIYIGQSTHMRYKAVWIYNSSENDCPYSVETKALASFNRKNYGVIFSCFNPEGHVSGFDRKAILFGFCPNRFGKFKISVLIYLGDKMSTLEIMADCTSLESPMKIDQETCPLFHSFMVPEIVTYFNSDCVTVSSLRNHGKVTKILMLHNHHNQDVLYYEWKNYEIPGIIKVNIEPRSGLIQPQSLVTFLIHVFTGFHECSLNIDIFCYFLNVSKRRIEEKEKIKQRLSTKQMKDEFTITEKGTIHPEKPIVKDKIKPTTFWKTITLKIIVYDSERADKKIDITRQLENAPDKELKQKMSNQEKTFNSNTFGSFSQIFECMIWDIIHSKLFSFLIKDSLSTVHNIKYSQLPVNIIERKNLNKKSYLIPPKRYVEDILHTMICMIVHKEFNLDTSHFPHPPDVRQISYQKIYTETQFKQSLKKSDSF